jgi:hypothetical protein
MLVTPGRTMLVGLLALREALGHKLRKTPHSASSPADARVSGRAHTPRWVCRGTCSGTPPAAYGISTHSLALTMQLLSSLTHSLSQRSCSLSHSLTLATQLLSSLSLTHSRNAAALLSLTHSLSQRSCSPLSHSLTHSHNAADTPLSHSLTLTTQLHSSLSLTHSRNAALLSLTCGVGAKLPGRARVLCAGVRASSAAAAAAAAG